MFWILGIGGDGRNREKTPFVHGTPSARLAVGGESDQRHKPPRGGVEDTPRNNEAPPVQREVPPRPLISVRLPQPHSTRRHGASSGVLPATNGDTAALHRRRSMCRRLVADRDACRNPLGSPSWPISLPVLPQQPQREISRSKFLRTLTTRKSSPIPNPVPTSNRTS
jgi:hypothetical protein